MYVDHGKNLICKAELSKNRGKEIGEKKKS